MKISLNMLTKIIDNENPDSTSVERLLWLSPDHKVVALFDIETKNALPKIVPYQAYLQELENGIRKKFINDPHEHYRVPDSRLSPTQLMKRDKAWKFIESLVSKDDDSLFNRRTRGKLIREAAEQHGCERTTIYRYLRLYWRRGQIKNALIPDYDNCGKNSQLKAGQKKRGPLNSNEIEEMRRGKPLTPEDEQKIALVITRHHLVKGKEKGGKKVKMSLGEAYSHFLEKYYSSLTYKNGELIEESWADVPTEDQFRNYYYKKMRDPVEDSIKKDGLLNYYFNHRPLLKSSRDNVAGPLAVAQIDPTPGDIWLVSRLNKKYIVGKPTIYAIVDVFSGAILMIYAGLKSASWAEAIKAIQYLVMDKKELCERYDIPYDPNEWLCQGQLPHRLIADGGEFEGFNANSLTNNYSMKLTTTAPYRGDDKGLVERVLGLIKEELVYQFPGSGKTKKRTEVDMSVEACIDIHTFREWLLRYLILYNNYRRQENYPLSKEMIEDNVTPYPMEIWRWGISNLKGQLPIEIDSKKLLQNLLPKSKASVSRAGIKYNRLYYQRSFPEESSKNEYEQKKWYSRASITESWEVDISYDPDLVNHIYLWLEDKKEPVLCTLIDRAGNNAFFNCDWAEVDAEFQRRNSEKRRNAPKKAKARSDFYNELQDEIKDELSEAKEARQDLSKAKQKANIRQNREYEQKLDTQAESLSKNGDIVNSPDSQPDDSPEESAKPDYVPPHNPTDSIRNARNKSIENQGDNE